MSLTRTIRLLALTSLVVLAALAAAPAYSAAAKRPNFVVIDMDDEPYSGLNAKISDWYNRQSYAMPFLHNQILKQGIQFTDYLTSFPLCAPSRATLLSGQYAHNNGVIRIGGPRGGWRAYKANPIYNNNLALWLQRAGYRTGHFGKFMNNYGGPDAPAEKTVPPGWNAWYSDATDNSTREDYGYTLNVDGKIVGPLGYQQYGLGSGVDPLGCPFSATAPCHYHEDQISLRAKRFVQNTASGQPFYIQLDYHTPHGDFNPPIGPEPPPRYYDSAMHTPLPRSPAFNEADISDKPPYLKQGAPRLSSADIGPIQTEFQKSLEAERGVDDGIRWVVNQIKRRGQLKNTYIFFTSDNGFFLGEHRLSRGKLLPYEPAVHVPMLVRGPGIKPGSKSKEATANIDIAPTIARLAGARASRYWDGRSMARFWRRPGTLSRRPILLEAYQAQTALIPGDPGEPPTTAGVADGVTRAGASAKAAAQNYVGIRLGPYKYVEYEKGWHELYDLDRDPFELHNRINSRRYAKVRAYMARNLQRLRGCKAKQCRYVAGPWPAPR